MRQPLEHADVRSSLDIIAQHIDTARTEAAALLAARGDIMTDEARDALAELEQALKAACDEARASSASGIMCDVYEALKEPRP